MLGHSLAVTEVTNEARSITCATCVASQAISACAGAFIAVAVDLLAHHFHGSNALVRQNSKGITVGKGLGAAVYFFE